MARLDHLVVVADCLEQGVAWCRESLGVEPSGGGSHARMGTHNRLLYLGSGIYLEVIAIDPQAGRPEFARWFGMDDREGRRRVAQAPELRTFVVATDDIASSVASLPALGQVEVMRRGDLQWKIAIRPDGVLQEGGCLPGVIEWPRGVHPTASMADTGCRLLCLEAHHPKPDRLAAPWEAMGLVPNEQLALRESPTPRLRARIATPHGEKTIG